MFDNSYQKPEIIASSASNPLAIANTPVNKFVNYFKTFLKMQNNVSTNIFLMEDQH